MNEIELRDEFFDYLNDIQLNNERLPKRYIRDAENPFDFYDVEEFRRRYRFSKDITFHVLLPLLSEDLKKINNRGLPFTAEFQLLICLRYYATSSFQAVSGDLKGVSQQSISNIIKRCSTIFASNCKNYVKFPTTNAEQRRNVTKFYNCAGFPTVSGCIDCTHIKICSTGGDAAEVFRNRKGYFSLNVQVVAGPSMEILDIVVRHPGSHHDSFIFNQSAVRIRFEQNQVIGILLGDSGYPCRPYLLTPVLVPGNPQEERYNKAQIRTRNIVERVFGVWKRIFPCLQKGLTTKLDTSIEIIGACAVLYNIKLKYNDQDFNDDQYEDEHENIPNMQNDNIGLAFRRQFIQQHF